MKKYKYIDLFAGVGGLSIGFDKAGFENVFSVEINKIFAQNYSKNMPDHKMLCQDITQLTNEDIVKYTNGKQIDIIVGGPPCQGFSIAGNIGRSFLDDKRNYLFKEFVRFVAILKPKMILLENVAALERHNKGETLNIIKKEFSKLGYIIKYKVINTKYYQIPQERRRIVLIGQLDNNKFNFPDESNDFISIKEAIGNLPVLKSGEISNIANHNAMHHSIQMLNKMAYVKDGGTRDDMPVELKPLSGDARKYIRYNSNKPSICITGDMRKVFHYNQNRALTNRELARIQTFPDDFTFVGNNGTIQQAIGNAVPPKLSYLLATKIKEALDDD